MTTDRRSLVRALAAGTVASLGGLAGCTTQDGTEPTDGTATDEPGSDETATEQPETDTPTDEPTDSTDTEEPTDGATVQVRTHDDYGDHLVDADGMTLYLFTQDEDGESACYGGCADNWPPLLADDPTAGDEVTAELGTTERDDGSLQVTAAEWPLYYFAGDSAPGDTSGQGLNDVWYLLAPDGSMITGDGGSDDGGSGDDESDGDDGGYGGDGGYSVSDGPGD